MTGACVADGQTALADGATWQVAEARNACLPARGDQVRSSEQNVCWIAPEAATTTARTAATLAASTPAAAVACVLVHYVACQGADAGRVASCSTLCCAASQ